MACRQRAKDRQVVAQPRADASEIRMFTTRLRRTTVGQKRKFIDKKFSWHCTACNLMRGFGYASGGDVEHCNCDETLRRLGRGPQIRRPLVLGLQEIKPARTRLNSLAVYRKQGASCDSRTRGDGYVGRRHRALGAEQGNFSHRIDGQQPAHVGLLHRVCQQLHRSCPKRAVSRFECFARI